MTLVISEIDPPIRPETNASFSSFNAICSVIVGEEDANVDVVSRGWHDYGMIMASMIDIFTNYGNPSLSQLTYITIPNEL